MTKRVAPPTFHGSRCRAPSHRRSALASGDEAPRLSPESRLDQRRLHSRADHRLAVEPLDRELLDQPVAGGCGQIGEGSGELLLAQLPKPEDSLPAPLD